MSEPMSDERLEFIKALKSDYPVITDLIQEVDRLRKQIASGLLLPEVDLAGEIAEGSYLCWSGNLPFVTDYRKEKGGWWCVPVVLRAYGPLPTPEGEQG